MAHGKHSTAARAARKAALMIAAKGDLEIAATALGEVQNALTQWADELSTDPENLRQTAIGVQAESIRAVVSGLTLRAASERLAVVAQLVADEAGAP